MFSRAVIIAVVVFFLDFLFHFFLTNPMETLTYFFVKVLLAFFIAISMFSIKKFYSKSKVWIIPLMGLLFSTLMSTYYRAWELGEAHVPFGSRAPDIIGISRSSILFSLFWWLGHASFFIAGAVIAIRLIKEKE